MLGCRKTSNGRKNGFRSHSEPANLNVIPFHWLTVDGVNIIYGSCSLLPWDNRNESKEREKENYQWKFQFSTTFPFRKFIISRLACKLLPFEKWFSFLPMGRRNFLWINFIYFSVAFPRTQKIVIKFSPFMPSRP
jgi:hypothetical protein